MRYINHKPGKSIEVSSCTSYLIFISAKYFMIISTVKVLKFGWLMKAMVKLSIFLSQRKKKMITRRNSVEHSK